MKSVVDASVSLDRETHQVPVSLDAQRVAIAVAFDPWVDEYDLPTSLDEFSKELDLAHEIGPNAAANLDLASDGGLASRILDQLKQAEKELDEAEYADLIERINERREELEQKGDDD